MTISEIIQSKLQNSLNPLHIAVENESHFHHVPKGSETHFKIVLVSSRFENLKLLARHRLVQEIISQEISQIKACSLHTFTLEEWNARGGERIQSPKCVGN